MPIDKREEWKACKIWRPGESTLDPARGQQSEGQPTLIGEGKCDIQPLSGGEKINATVNGYEAKHRAYVEEYVGGKILAGDLLESDGVTAEIVFPAGWGDHWELDLKG